MKKLEAYLYRGLPPERTISFDHETTSPHWALAALGFIKPEAMEFWLAQESPWETFLREVRESPLFGDGFEKVWRRKLSHAREILPRTVSLIRSEFGGIST